MATSQQEQLSLVFMHILLLVFESQFQVHSIQDKLLLRNVDLMLRLETVEQIVDTKVIAPPSE